MENTHFGNPHGLNCIYNTSTCEDLGKLTIASMKKYSEIIKKIVGC